MARGSHSSAQTPLQEITAFFLTAPLELARVGLDVGQTILASREAGESQGAASVSGAGAASVAALVPPATRVQADGRVRRGRRPRTGLPAVLAQQVGLDPVVLPPQGDPEDSADD